jgi:O-antigen/teichoic acid export membrane protein
MAYDDRDDDDDLDISIDRGGHGENVPNYLALSILVTIFCCWPLGIPAIVYAAKVNGLVAQGDYEAARSASRTAKTLCIVNIILTLIGICGWCVIAFGQPRGF